MKAIVDPLAYSAEHRRGLLAPCPVEIEAILPAACAVREVKLGKQMVTSKGSFSKVDVVVWFQQGSDHLRAGMVQCLLCAEGVRGAHHVACISMYHHRDGFAWSRVDPPTVFVSASLLLLTVAWYEEDKTSDVVRLLVPRVHR